MIPNLADFTGHWVVTRRIDDRLAGQTGSFAGTAVFTPSGEVLQYRESGELRLGAAAPMLAERAYLWRALSGRIVVDYADGRPFHDFDPRDGRATHDCAPDVYVVRYDFARWPDWLANWHVTGPRKDYDMVTEYRRA